MSSQAISSQLCCESHQLSKSRISSVKTTLRMILICCAIAVLVKVLSAIDGPHISIGGSVRSPSRHSLIPRAHEHNCREIHNKSDQCGFVHRHCANDEAGLISYLSFYYCDLAEAKPLAFVIIIAWLSTLFASIGISASDFLCINLATMADMLGMSQTLAGVTFLAFGNGSPDVFSTWAAFSSHNGSLAIGELIGAAGFITTVIAGSMAIVKPFRVSRKSFVRDALFFTVAAALSLLFLVDGHLALWESAIMVAFYFSYVVTVLLWHSFSHKRKKQEDRQARAREHFQSSESLQTQLPGQSIPSLTLPDTPAHHSIQSDSLLLRPEAQEERHGHISDLGDEYDEDEDEDNHRREQFLADVGQEIRRTHRRTLSRMASSNQSIRPSLLGALEFGSLLASLSRSRNQEDTQTLTRRHSDHATRLLHPHTRTRNIHASLNTNTIGTGSDLGLYTDDHSPQHQDASVISRLRSASANAVDITQIRSQFTSSQAPPTTPQQSVLLLRPDNGRTHEISHSGASPVIPAITISNANFLESGPSSPRASSVLLPFPAYTDNLTGPISTALPREIHPSASVSCRTARTFLRHLHSLGAEVPTWADVRRTLFPTLDDWKNQTIPAKFVSLAMTPTILLLTITIPVVQGDNEAPSSDEIPSVLSRSAS